MVVALTVAACGTTTTPAAQHTAWSDQPKLDLPRSQDTPESFAVPTTRPARQRPARSSTRPRTTAPSVASGCTLDVIRQRESGDDYGAVSPSGHRGAYQFEARTWRGAVSRAGHPEYADTPANEAPPDVQDAAARQLYAERGTQSWSVCR